MTEPRIENLAKIQLVGKRITMSMVGNRTAELWKSFMPDRSSVLYRTDENYYSVEIYPEQFFNQFNPNATFEKWAAVKVSQAENIPESMEVLEIPAGTYAVFPFKGVPANVPQFMQYVYGRWLPKSGYQLDNRPHFGLMGEKYKNNDPDSEEDFWIPVRPR